MKLINIILFSFFIIFNLISNEKSSSSRNWYEKKRIAFILGINEYQNTTNLKYAVKDSREMKNLFLEVGYFDKIYLLNDLDGLEVYEDKKIYSNQKILPYKKNIEEIYKFILSEKPDTFLLYYSGHGFIEGIDNKNSIAPKDVEVLFEKDKPRAKNGILISEMADGFLKSQPKNFKNPEQVIFLIDACRSPLPEDNLAELKIKRTKFTEVSKKDFDFLKNYSSTKKLNIEKFDEKIPKLVNDAKGVVILIGTSPNESSLEEDEIESGKFTYYLKKAISGAVQDETPAEYITLDSLEIYIKKKFDIEYEEYISSKRNEKEFVQSKPIQALYKLSTETGFTGDFLISYSRPKLNQSTIDKRFYLNEIENTLVEAKLLLNKNLDRYDLKFFAKSKETGRYYPQSLEGVSRLKYNLERNEKNELISFEAEEFDSKEESIFTHFLEEKNGVWEYSGIYIPTEEDKKNQFRKKIKFQKQKFDVSGNNLSSEFFDKDGKQISLDSGYAVRVEKKWDEFGEKILEQYYDFRNKFISYNGLYSYYVAKYLDKGQPLFEEFRLNENELGLNEYGISKIEYLYDNEYKLISILYLDEKLKLISNINHISKKELTYNIFCVKKLEKQELSKYEYKNLAKEKLKLEKEKFYKREKFDSCIETETNYDKDLKLKSDQDGIAKKVFGFNESGLKISEEFYRHTGKPIQKNGIFKTEYSYDNKERLISKKFYSDKNEKTSDESGIHEYRYTFGKGKKYFLNYKEALLESIAYFDEKGEKTVNSQNVFEEEMLYTYDKELKKYKLEITHFFDKDGNLIKIFPVIQNIYVYDIEGNPSLYITYSWTQNLIWQNPSDIKFIYSNYVYDDKFRLIGEENFYGKNSEMNQTRKLTYDENNNVISEEKFDFYGKNILKSIYKHNSKNQILTAEYLLKEKKSINDIEDDIVKENYSYDKNGNLIKLEYLNKDGKLAENISYLSFSKTIRKYDEKNNLIKEENFNHKEGLSEDIGRSPQTPAKTIIQYNQDNQIIKKEFFGPDNQPKDYNQSYNIFPFGADGAKDIDYSSKIEYFYDKNKKLNQVKLNFIDLEKNCSIKYEIVKFQNEKRYTSEYYDEKDKLKLNSCLQIAKTNYSYDKKKNLIKEEYFDEKLKPKSNASGILKIIYEYDENGNKILEEFVGKNSKQKNGISSIAKYIWKYNSKNQIILEEKFGESGYFGLAPRIIYDYDKKGNLVYKEYLKDKNTPLDIVDINALSISKEVIEFDLNALEEVENENIEDWKKIKNKLTEFNFLAKFKNINSDIFDELQFLRKEFDNSDYKLLNNLISVIGERKGKEIYNQVEDFEKKIIKERKNSSIKEYKKNSKGNMKLYEERFDRKRGMISELKDINDILQTNQYDLYFPNPKGIPEKNLIHLKLDRFFRPYKISFEKK